MKEIQGDFPYRQCDTKNCIFIGEGNHEKMDDAG